MESSKIYLCKADCSILGNISGLKAETCSLKKHAVEQWEISFDVERYTDGSSHELKQSDYYDSIDTMMRLYLDGKDQMYFVIDSELVINGEGLQETKSVTAHSIECELSTLYLKNFKINCGTKDSQEYLATDSSGNYYNVNPYTNLPYEYISLVNYNNPQLSLLHLALQNTGWSVSENISPEICSIKKSFDVSGTDIYDFFMNTVSPSTSIIFQFDRKHKKICLVKADDFGEDTGIFVTMRNLMNSFEISSSSNNDLITKLVPTGGDNLGIEQSNFGDNCLINLDYFMNTLNEYGDYKYVSKELHDKYNLWKNYREAEKVTFNEKQYTRREQYTELSKLYNQTILDINELKNRVPNDGALTDYKTFSLEELKLHLNAFNNALLSLITLYKNEYGVTEIGDAPNYIPTPSSATNIKNTPYWHDFYAYKEAIIPQIKEALKMYCQTDSNGNLMTDATGHYIEMEFGNPAYYANPSIVKEVDAYKYEWSLYGLDELEAKKKAWCEVANLLFSECFIKSGTISIPTTYRTPDDNGWNDLSEAQKKSFTTKTAYIDKLNQYLDYMSFDSRNNLLTKTNCKGIIRQCEDAIASRKNKIVSLESLQNSYQTQRKELAESASIKNFKVDNITLFNEQDLNVINGMIREQDYNNPNILITNLDDIVTTVDAQEELYQDATEELYKLSQPQYSFSTDMDNLYALEEFKCYHDDFEVGNFIRAGFEIHEELFDNEFIKLRLMSITYNPLDLSGQNISVEFSTMVKELNGISDLASMIGEKNSYSSNNSSSSSSASTYGNNDVNVQLSNNVLNALLNTELFGEAVSDVVLDSIKANKGNFNTLLSHSGVFDSLEAGQIKISGECLFDIVKSNNYVDGKSGSMLDLTDGSFSFAAGTLTYDPQNGLIIKGVASADSLENIQTTLNGLNTGVTGINGACINTGNIVSNNYDGTVENPLGNTQGSILQLLDGHFSFCGGNLKYDGTGLIINGNGEFSGNITATTLTANQSGTIAGWTFNENGFYKGENSLSEKNGMYLGNDGFSVSDYFSVNNEGFVLKDKNYIKNENKTTSIGFNQLKLNKKLTSLFPQLTNQIVLYVVDDDCTETAIDCLINYDENGISGNNNTLHFDTSYTISELSCVYSSKKTSDIVFLYTAASKCCAKKIFVYKLNDFLDFSETDFYILNNITAGYNLVGVSVIYDNVQHNFFTNSFNTQKIGMLIDSNAKTITIDNIDITNSGIIGRNNYSIQFGGNLGSEPSNCPYSDVNYDENYSTTSTTIIDFDGIRAANNEESYYDFYFSKFYGIKSPATYEDKVSGKALYINSEGLIGLSSSSARFKNSISTNLTEVSDPHGLYDIEIVQHKYNDDYFSSPNDEGIGKYFIGFIAENVAEKFRDGATFDKDGLPDGWDIRYMFPAALKLIQEQHKEIDKLKEQIESIKCQFQDLKTRIIN